MDAAELVRAARRVGGLSQRALAQRLGVSAATVGAWEARARQPSFDTVRRVLATVDRDLAIRARGPEASPELTAYLRLPLTARLRVTMGEPPSPYARAHGAAWRGLLALGRLGTVVVEPPVATGVWVPVRPQTQVHVTVHAARERPPALEGVEVAVSPDPAPASLIPVSLLAPVRVWVLPPTELLLAETALLEQAAALLHDWAGMDDAGRRMPAHRDPDEWDEAGRMLRTKGTERLERPVPELGRAWRLGGAVSLAQAVRSRPSLG